MNAIEIKNLTKSLQDFNLGPINLTLPSGCIVGLIGKNGAGKSTTIKLILDMIERDSGSVTILGKDNKQDIHLTKEDIGVVLDEIGLPDCLTALEVNSFMKYTFKNWNTATFLSYLSTLNIPEKKKFKDFSRGMKMKLSIAIALSHNAKLLILDEATSGLDPVVRDEVVDIFLEFTRNENHSILISSHIVSDLEKLCDYIAFLHNGKLLLFEEKDILKEQYGLIHCNREQLKNIDPSAIIGKKESQYSIELLVKRNEIGRQFDVSPVDIEQLFVFMVKGGN